MSTIVTDINQLDLNGTYTYADYLLWRIDERLELIKGKIFKCRRHRRYVIKRYPGICI